MQKVIFERARVRASLTESRRREMELVERLNKLAEEQLEAERSDPAAASAPLQTAAQQLRTREKAAREKCEREMKKLRSALKESNKVFRKINSDIVTAFKKYAELYLDEKCDVSFLQEDSLPVGRGHQVKPPHSAFFPVISGEIRPNSQALSDAQRSFVDLAFRMAVIEVWHKTTKKTVTLFIETPEGAVDLAYMSRVARMVRTFGEQGHTVIVTTNLNNDLFLPQLLASVEKREREGRILNMLALGRPRPVQQQALPRFERILQLVADQKTTDE